MSEDRLQASCFQWFWNEYPKLRRTLFHVPNGGYRNAREGQRFKALGVVAGVPDLIWMFNGRAICFELKTGSKVSEAQEMVHLAFKEQKIDTWIIRSLEEFQEIIQANIYEATNNDPNDSFFSVMR